MNLCEVRYKEIQSELKTGDLMLFHGMLISSRLNELITGCNWSHVGMIIRPSDIGVMDHEGLLLWESNTLMNLPDVILKKPKTGPMLVDLYQRMKTDLSEKYDNQFLVRFNECDITQEMLEKLRGFIDLVHGDDFVKSEFQMDVEVFEGRFLNHEVDNDTYFCSELMADTMKHMGLLSTLHPSNAYEPKDFSADGNLPLIKRGRLLDGPRIDISAE